MTERKYIVQEAIAKNMINKNRVDCEGLRETLGDSGYLTCARCKSFGSRFNRGNLKKCEINKEGQAAAKGAAL